MKHLDLGEKNIYISLLFIETEEELDTKYRIINKNKPVPLPININDWKLFGRHIEDFFTKKYNKYCKNSKNPHCPNFNMNCLIEYINDNNIAKKFQNNHKLFIKEITNLNLFYAQTYNQSIIPHFRTNIVKKIQKMQSINPLFLTFYKNFEWIDRIIYKISNNLKYKDIKHIPKSYRVKIKKKLRRKVWDKYYNGNTKGFCYVCSSSIDIDEFECGHVNALFYGGKTEKSNLEPVCSICNNDMGIQNLEEYKKELEIQINN